MFEFALTFPIILGLIIVLIGGVGMRLHFVAKRRTCHFEAALCEVLSSVLLFVAVFLSILNPLYIAILGCVALIFVIKGKK